MHTSSLGQRSHDTKSSPIALNSINDSFQKTNSLDQKSINGAKSRRITTKRWRKIAQQVPSLLSLGISIWIFGFGGIALASTPKPFRPGCAGFYSQDDRFRHALVPTNNGDVHEIL